MAFHQSDAVEVKRIQAARAGASSPAGPSPRARSIERVPVLVMTSEDEYARGPGEQPAQGLLLPAGGPIEVVLALGYGSLYNHSYKPNARYDDVGPSTKAFVALRRHRQRARRSPSTTTASPRSRAKVWFDVVEANARPSS